MKECIRIHTDREDGSVMRPSGSSDPLLSWAQRLAGLYQSFGGIAVSYPHSEQLPALDITPDFHQSCPHGAEHIRMFAASNRLRVTVNRNMCAVCAGADGCVAEKP